MSATKDHQEIKYPTPSNDSDAPQTEGKRNPAVCSNGDSRQKAQANQTEKRLAKWRKKAPSADLHLVELLESYQRYRYSALALGICCVALIGASMALYGNGIIDAAAQNAMILGSYLFIGIMLFLVFARVRPLKKEIAAWNDALNAAVSPSKKKKDDSETPAPSRRAKNPDTPEYKHYRRLWRLCIFAAVVIMLSAMVLIRINPDDVTIALVILTSSYIFLAIAVYLERSKMKPLREEWNKLQEKREKKRESKRASRGKAA